MFSGNSYSAAARYRFRSVCWKRLISRSLRPRLTSPPSGEVYSLDSFYRLPYTTTMTAHGEWGSGSGIEKRREGRGVERVLHVAVHPCSPSLRILCPIVHSRRPSTKEGRARAAASLRSSGGGLRRRKERIGLRRRRRRRSIKHKALQKSGTYYYCSPVRSPPQCLAGSGDDW